MFPFIGYETRRKEVIASRQVRSKLRSSLGEILGFIQFVERNGNRVASWNVFALGIEGVNRDPVVAFVPVQDGVALDEDGPVSHSVAVVHEVRTHHMLPGRYSCEAVGSIAGENRFH